MSKITFVRISIVLSLLAAFLFGYSARTRARDNSMKPEELVQKHLISIGTPEARAAARNRVLGGTAEIIFRLGGKGQAQGKGNIVSEGQSIRLQMLFPALEYPGELLTFNGSKVEVDNISPGVRSRLADFVFTHDTILKEGLLGGTLSTAWPLLDLGDRQPKLEYTGLKKQEGKELHELKYKARKGGGDLQIWLYFDPETFRHVRTRYKLAITAPMGTRPDQSAQLQESTYTLTEDFGDFLVIDGLTLPRAYKLNLTTQQQASTTLTDWSITVSQILHNERLDPHLFSVR